jgi:hypothetical protein
MIRLSSSEAPSNLQPDYLHFGDNQASSPKALLIYARSFVGKLNAAVFQILTVDNFRLKHNKGITEKIRAPLAT